MICLGHALKESLDVRGSRDAMVAGVGDAGCEVAAALCFSDGGDGVLDAIGDAVPGRRCAVECSDPLGNPVRADLLFDPESRTAMIEMALAAGLALVPPGKRDILKSGTAGVGDLVAEAVELGARRIVVGIGGSATCDGGAGMLCRLSERLLQEPGFGFVRAMDLAKPPALPLPQLRARLSDIEMVACTDVDNPLCGPRGTAACFGPQKGATPVQVDELDRLMGKWADHLEWGSGSGCRDTPGAGAAGGLGFALALIGAEVRSGAGVLFELLRLEERLQRAWGIVTAEGRFDATSLHGKAPWSAARVARKAGREALIVCGAADSKSVAQAESEGVRVVPFAESLPRERRVAESPRALREAVARGLTGMFAAGGRS